MRKLYYYIAAALLLGSAGCQQEEIAPVEKNDDVLEVYASIEDIEDAQTRTYLSGSEVYWSSGDQIAVFYKNTLRKRFNVTPESIDSKNATFLQDEDYVQMGGNVKISHNVAYYPFCDVTCSPDGASYTMSNLTLPATQSYVEGSVGLGAFPMVAVTENTDDVDFRFKNICGVMQFQLKGYGFVKSVSVKGNSSEVIAGSAVVMAGYGKEPSIALASDGGKVVTLDCGESGVELDETDPVSFYIALPPVQFEGGFTITVTDTWGGSREYSTTKKNPILRSKGLRMPAKEYIGVRPPQEGDYVDEYGINHGQGIEIDGVVWAPVNCGYKAPTADSKGFPYGKLYQWGRKYGQGYDDSDESYPSGDDLVEGPVALNLGQAEENVAKFYYTTTSLYNWCSCACDPLWNNGTKEKPIKSEYDPCPEGWRVPTQGELSELKANEYSYMENEHGQSGYWFGDGDANLFFSLAGRINYVDGEALARGSAGCYWSSGSYGDDDAFFLYLRAVSVITNGNYRSNGRSVRCVKDDSELIPVESLMLSEGAVTLSIGASASLATTIVPAHANHQFAYWWSEDESIATVDSNGKITAVAEGSTTITAMAGMQTVECLVTVVPESTIDMSLSGTANSYIVSQKGSYKFKTVKGNSSESVGAVSSAEVLWETFGTDVTPNVGDLVKAVSYKDGEVIFQTADTFKEGNAAIAAKDASGNILWSWHIWMTDQPEEQVYYNNAGTMMDRNLGATSATPGDVGALGLLYQWGRKDPFLGSSSISTSTLAMSTISWPSRVSSNVSTGTIEYTIAHPTTFITYYYTNGDWYYTGDKTTDNTRWTTAESDKSVYDPCPTGWRVPDGGINGVWLKALGSSASLIDKSLYDNTNKGVNFSGKFGPDTFIWYPATGCREGYGGYVGRLDDVGYHGNYWATSSISPSTNNAYCLDLSNEGEGDASGDSSRAYGYSVRCAKE